MISEQHVNNRYDVENISCRWLGGDERSLHSAEVVRVIIDANIQNDDAASSLSNIKWQPGVLWKVVDRIRRDAPRAKLIVGPAGFFTVDLESRLSEKIEDLQYYLAESGTNRDQVLRTLDELGCLDRDLLIGLDSCEGKTLPLQTVIHLSGSPNATLDNTVLKIFATNSEQDSLVGWKICVKTGKVPSELAQSRLISTEIGNILILVCNDGQLMRDKAVGKAIERTMKEHILEMAGKESVPRYVLLATHWLKATRSPRSGTSVFIDVIKCVSKRWKEATVIPTMFTPHADLEKIPGSDYLPVIGREPSTVATLLVVDKNLDD
ncbi:hypothetical protein [Zavarzinella formosa]|uniref:hypothetical protein n=1 Tax=Zavarzinella formosa TaxID=360055 RepID=UPI0002FE71F7|nr:hypothetical protein [Zavarzinella formosa]